MNWLPNNDLYKKTQYTSWTKWPFCRSYLQPIRLSTLMRNCPCRQLSTSYKCHVKIFFFSIWLFSIYDNDMITEFDMLSLTVCLKIVMFVYLHRRMRAMRIFFQSRSHSLRRHLAVMMKAQIVVMFLPQRRQMMRKRKHQGWVFHSVIQVPGLLFYLVFFFSCSFLIVGYAKCHSPFFFIFVSYIKRLSVLAVSIS